MTTAPKTLDQICDEASARILPEDKPGVDLKALIKKLQRVKGGE
ncbi:hypothetical protein [Ensifer sp. OV372]|nr:hypothetical protein [Ensifer sp. OV372]SFG87680.1 hypothetical protein SAMN05216459_11119 [Ensifer sp. OV372]